MIAEQEFDKEEEVYREAVRLRTSSLESYYQNACALYEQKAYEECIAFIDYDILQNEDKAKCEAHGGYLLFEGRQSVSDRRI